jgi:2-polyprenyl-3-methyl-5-hydroxy-6-metoxy-1,4-benzoquinol methylase
MGRFGNRLSETRCIWLCGRCGAGWLDGDGQDYSSSEYRELVDGGADPTTYYRLHDGEQADKLRLIGTGDLRGRVVVDFGAGGGAFLDLVRGMASATIAIEPGVNFHPELRRKGHVVFDLGPNMSSEWRGRADLAVCFSVVEHVEDPVRLLREILTALKPGGRALVSTPNRNDWMIELLPDDYAPFFYRHVHRWYFDADSLVNLARTAGFVRVKPFHIHRFDLSNFIVWLRDRRPSGLGHLRVPATLSTNFSATLEASGRSDYLYAWLDA